MNEPAMTIPEAPREVRWATLLRERRLLGGLGIGCALFGSVVTVLGIASGRNQLPFDDLVLDSGNQTARASVHTVERSEHRSFSQKQVRHAFVFAADGGRTVQGESWAEDAVCSSGDIRMVEYLPTDPSLCRIVGTRKASTPTWLSLGVLGTLAAGFVALLLWLRNLLRLRIALTEGRRTSARVVSAQSLGHDEWRVSYQFTDPDGVQQLGRQRLRNSGNLGSGTLHPLIHDERAYALHRLVVADDFLIP